MQGLPISNYSKGMDMVKAMNAVGYDAMTLGNHEFDFGLDTALAYKNQLNFPIVSANVFYKDTGKRPFEPYTIVTKQENGEEVKVALIGLTTPETTVKTHPNNIEKIMFKKPAPVAIDMINEIGDGADYFVFMTHLGIDETTLEDETSTYLAKELSKTFPDKRIFIADGHSHTPLNQGIREGNILIGQTGNHLNNVGMMTGKYDKETPELTAVLHPFSELKDLTPDPAVEAIVEQAKANFDGEMSEVVLANNAITFNGERENVRARETNLGNLIGDSLLEYGKTGFKEPSDFAIMNGGGIRQTIKPGQVTKGDIVGVMPFGNIVSQIQVTGNEIYAMFENSLRSIHATDEAGNVILDENKVPALGANGGFLQVSDSIEVIYDSNLTEAQPESGIAGKRVLSIKIRNQQGQFVEVPRNDTTKYNMVTNDFLAAGGDGYTMLVGKPVEQGPSMDEVFMSYLANLSASELSMYEKELPYTRIISKLEGSIEDETTAQDILKGKIEEFSKLDALDYTAYSWAAFSKELEASQKVLEEKNEELAKTSTEALVAASEKLVSVYDLTKLVTESKDLKQADYTAETWSKLTLALTDAENLLALAKDPKNDISEEEVTQISAKLKTAVSELKAVGKADDTNGNNGKGSAGNSGQTSKKPTGNALPKTGEANGIKIISLIGLGSIAASGIYLFRKKETDEAA